MTTKLNGGSGAVICDSCGITIGLGTRDRLLYCYTTIASDHCQVGELDFCSAACKALKELARLSQELDLD